MNCIRCIYLIEVVQIGVIIKKAGQIQGNHKFFEISLNVNKNISEFSRRKCQRKAKEFK